MTVDVRRQHQEWLDLLDRSGPFLTVPVLRRIWPAGLDIIQRGTMDEFRPAFEAWRDDPVGGQRRWVTFVLARFLDWGDRLAQGPDLPSGFDLVVPEHDARIAAEFAFLAPDRAPRLLGMMVPPGSRPGARATGGWSASAADRLALLLRRHRVPIGLATDGRWWTLVWAPVDGATSTTTWDGALWLEERETLRAFRCVLDRARFLGVPDAETLPRLLEAGLGEQEEVTESLGRQVRQAVEMLVEAIGRAGRRGGPAEDLLRDVEPEAIYHAAVTVMMRLLFLFFAEERILLPADDDLYLQSYSAAHLVDTLRGEANNDTEEALEHRTAAWQRLLALFRAVHGGLAHDRLRIPAYGGAVFDPDRHPWLEGRSEADAPDAGSVLPVDDRTVLHALEAVQYVVVSKERRRLSFSTLDVEQIGYVYEGLLGYDALRAHEPVLGLQGKAGEEPEVPVSRLEEIGDDVSKLQELMGLSESRIRKLLAGEDLRPEQRLREACSGDEVLVARVRPFARLLRLDLRGVPVVVPSGGIYVTASERRRLSGTHYTPRDLAEKVVVGALEPLVYNPGQLDTADRQQWRRRPSAEILGLRVADIAMGSGAFLVSACRYLAGELIEARAAEGDERAAAHLRNDEAVPVDAESDPVVIEARREVIEHCLYGGDINQMAVEMAKLSLWLVSLSREKPFSFLDDRLVWGDSLLGLTSIDQLRTLHLDPKEARKAGERGFDLWGEVEATLKEVERLRRDIAQEPTRDARDARVKELLLREAEHVGQPLHVIADGLVGIGLAAAGARRKADGDLLAFAPTARDVLRERDPGVRELRLQELADTAAYQLDIDRPSGAFERRPTHWPLAFPEVFEEGGFDAIVGNPPFLGGQKLTGAFGVAYREYLVRWIANDARGSADLLAYFLLVANRLLNTGGQAGLIGTNTMAQGDTREVGLDQLVAEGGTIRAAVKSAKWPTRMVNLEYAVVWSSRRAPAEDIPRDLEGRPVPLISTSLDEAEIELGQPFRLVANRGIAFQGSILLGLGFTMTPEEARQLIEHDPRNGEVLFPYINGEDLNSRPDCSASRWVINFRDWPLEQAEQYPDCIDIVRRLVKPERERQHDRGARMYWWRFLRPRPELHKAIAGMREVLAIARVSKVVIPVRVPTGGVYSDATGVFAYDDGAHLALLSSAFHYCWAIAHSSTLETRIRYTPSDVFETFPQSPVALAMASAGEALDEHRRSLMLNRQLGLTAVYNLVHSSNGGDPDIQRLRDIHVVIDEATRAAYGWDDLRLDHGFHDTAQGTRFTISPEVRREVLRRLLDLNLQRHAEEEASGLTKQPKGRRRQAQPSLPLGGLD